MEFVSRAGQKLDFALNQFKLNLNGLICADLGCSTGGFTDCLLQHGAAKVYAVDTGYGVLDYRLRNHPKVIVLERQNAMHVLLPEKVDFVSIDVGWTPQRLILPHTKTLLKPAGLIISLIKPHYEAKKAHLSSIEAGAIFEQIKIDIVRQGFILSNSCLSPIVGEKGGNTEYLVLISINTTSTG